VREAGRARPGEPALVLLHGWTATADLNWYPAYGPLARRHHVIAADLRGHGRGLRRPERFRLSDCADDVVALADQLGLTSIVPVGYSMGGLVAQLLWRRHRDRVAGLVLCATSRNFRETPGDHLFFNGLTGLAVAGRLAPPEVREQFFARYLEARIDQLGLGPWGSAELAGHDLRCLLEAGAAIGTFSSDQWIGGVDVPAAVVVTTADTKIPPARQRRLAAAMPGAAIFEVDADHHACPRQADRFVPALLDAVAHVVGPGRGVDGRVDRTAG